MATVIPAAQQVGGLVTVAIVLIVGITLLVGGTAGGWFDGDDDAHKVSDATHPATIFSTAHWE